MNFINNLNRESIKANDKYWKNYKLYEIFEKNQYNYITDLN